MPFVEALAGVRLAFQLVDGASNVSELAKSAYVKLVTQGDVGTVYDKVKDLMDNRRVLCDADSFRIVSNTSIDPVMSPALQYLIDLYSQGENTGVIYVLYDKAGQGKTEAGRALLHNFYEFGKDEHVKGFMVTGQMIDTDYTSVLAKKIGATGVEGWIHALLLAMDRPLNEQPSILILDSFNSVGTDKVNLHFIKSLYGLMNGKKNMFVVVVTQNKEVANALCGLNGGQRIAPIPGCYNGDDKTSPTWKEEPWDRERLIEAVRYEFNGEKSFGDECTFDFIVDGMTPLQANIAASKIFREKKTPKSPRPNGNRDYGTQLMDDWFVAPAPSSNQNSS